MEMLQDWIGKRFVLKMLGMRFIFWESTVFGSKTQSKEQKEDMAEVFKEE